MVQSKQYYEQMPMPDRGFLFKLNEPGLMTQPVLFENHWHESMELIYMISGEARFQCNSRSVHGRPGDLILINSCDLHGGYLISGTVSYHCAIFETELLHNRSTDICETKYIDPIVNHRIMFRNRIPHDNRITNCIQDLTEEYGQKERGYELAVKGILFRLFALLLRHYQDTPITAEEYANKKHQLEQLAPVVQYLEENYFREIGVDPMARLANMSRYHFCRSFKSATGRTLSDYVNQIRVNKAEYLLKNSQKNITHIAMDMGYNDINYFSRVFKKYKGQTPTAFRKS
jgi:AraC-like DNA-binding protein